MLLGMQVCSGAASPVCGGQELVSTADVRGQRREGLSWLASAALFSLGFSLHVSPPVINVKAAVETKGPLQRCNGSLFHHPPPRLPAAPSLMMSSFQLSSFASQGRKSRKCGAEILAPTPPLLMQLLSNESALVEGVH